MNLKKQVNQILSSFDIEDYDEITYATVTGDLSNMDKPIFNLGVSSKGTVENEYDLYKDTSSGDYYFETSANINSNFQNILIKGIIQILKRNLEDEKEKFENVKIQTAHLFNSIK